MFDNIFELKDKFDSVSKLGYVKAISDNYSAIGETLEKLLGIDANNSTKADYKGIEIKVKGSNSNFDISLFSITPKCDKCVFVPEDLLNNYGYYSVKQKRKVLYSQVFANKIYSGNSKFRFFLNVDKESKKIFLFIFDSSYQIVEKNFFWLFDDIYSRLNDKMKFLALVKVSIKNFDNWFYYKYYNISFYKLKSFDQFIDLIDKGVVYIDFNIGGYTFDKNTSKIKLDYHGTRFVIPEKDLLLMYDEINL